MVEDSEVGRCAESANAVYCLGIYGGTDMSASGSFRIQVLALGGIFRLERKSVPGKIQSRAV